MMDMDNTRISEQINLEIQKVKVILYAFMFCHKIMSDYLNYKIFA